MRPSAYRAAARAALRGALTVRAHAEVPRDHAICVFDVAHHLGLEVRFAAIASLGGMYERQSNIILVPTERPRGRQGFTCAHELGHWHFHHGTRLDRLLDVEETADIQPEELIANLFASYLLMPARAVETAFARRGWVPSSVQPLEAYTVATQLGVGYETLVRHLRSSLGLISESQARRLLRTTPKAIRSSVLGTASAASFLVIADSHWSDAPIDLEVGDLAITPKGVRLEGTSVGPLGSHTLGDLFLACAPGISRVESHGALWSSFIRVSRRNYSGRSIYRHLDEPDDLVP